MKRVQPNVYLMGETKLDYTVVKQYLLDIGVNDGFKIEADENSDTEKLIEIMGRACYKSFGSGLNSNISKIREGNDLYISNIIKSRHGSVLEHCSASFMFNNVSRVFTHELVRHRAGTAMSQESLRYVRLEDLGLWLPEHTLNEIDKECPGAKEEFTSDIEELFKILENYQIKWAKLFKLDDGKNFSYKKKATSMMRRGAPIGLATSIGFTMNHRTLRHILSLRTSPHSEEEIRLVFSEVGKICKQKWPNIYADFTIENIDGIDCFKTDLDKI